MAHHRSDVEALARGRLPEILSEALGLESSLVKAGSDLGYDFVAKLGGKSLLIDVVGASSPAVMRHWARLQSIAKKNDIPLLVVPHMTPSVREASSVYGVNWVDLSGNAHVRAPGIQVRIEGNPERFAKPGRPASVFERRSSRLSRLLLQHPGREWSVRECARESGLNEGHVSRIVARLVSDELLLREGKRLRVANPMQLLDAWRDAADFEKHRVLRGHVPARSGEDLLRQLSARLVEAKLEHAATGLGAAWLDDGFAMFRLASFYLRAWPSDAQLEQLHFREDQKGANVWLVLPADDGVFDGSRVVDGVPCVHPLQVYLDLKGHPERAAEAAAHLKQNPLLLGAPNGAAP